MVKSLLTAMAIVGASASAFAFPTLNLNPEPGEYDNAQSLSTFNISSTESFTIVQDAKDKPYLESLEVGDVVNCSNFYFFEIMPGEGTTILSFDSSSITENGEWELVFPAGCMKDASGNPNELLAYKYTLNDPNLNLGDFPQIKLISSDPANGAKLPYWGEYVGKVSFVTDNDAAVNYIDWTLYDITNGADEANREWVRQGNESRIDVNRTFGDASDQWVNGLYINVGGYNEPLIEGRTYRLILKFCGIGYDPVTNQYPTPQQQAKSLELETYLDFYGQTKATEYSPAVVEGVMPDPETYDFDNIDMRTFTITYTGYVKPSKFVYSIGMGAGTASAGTFEPEDANEAGYAKVWNFIFSESVLKGTTGTIAITIEAKDADGLYVKGNGGFPVDDYEYKIEWICNLGADVITSVSPENNSTVKELSSITIGNESNKSMFLSYNAEDRPRIVSMGRAGSFAPIDLDEPVFSDDEKTATWTFDPITISGTYSLIIPKNYFNIGTEFESTSNSQTTFVYIVEGEDEPIGDIKEDLEPASVSIENNQVLSSLESIVLTFSDVTFRDFDPSIPGNLYRENESSDYELVESVEPTDNDFFSPTEYTYTFTSPVSEAGKYKFVIPAGAFYDESYDTSDHTSGRISPELVYYFEIEGGNKLVAVAPVAGSTVTELSTVTISNSEGKAMSVNPETIERVCIMGFVGGDQFYQELEEPVFNDDKTEATWNFDAIKAAGSYSLIIPDNYFILGEEGNFNTQAMFAFVIEGDDDPVVGEVEHDLVPVSASIEDNEVFNTPLASISLKFGSATYTPFDYDTWELDAPGYLYREGENSEYVEVETVQPTADDDFMPTEYTYTFSKPINVVGNYKFVIPAGTFFDDEWETKHDSPEIVYYFQIETKGSGIESILAENETATVYDIMGRVVMRNANADQLKNLGAGIYIINGKKYIVK